MTKEFVPHELSVKLKELGFDEPCFGYPKQGTVYPINTDMLPEWSAAPLFQQAFRWFRDEHSLCSHVRMFDGEFTFEINEVEFVLQSKGTHEEAELACLTKLIEIVEQSKR